MHVQILIIGADGIFTQNFSQFSDRLELGG
jgi:hypothetical protein